MWREYMIILQHVMLHIVQYVKCPSMFQQYEPSFAYSLARIVYM